jgi:hypothetical protein
MFDLTDLSSTLKKQGKKAADLAMKPVKFVATPLLKVNDSLKKTMFGPDIHLFHELIAQQQEEVFGKSYIHWLSTLQTALTNKKFTAKKSHAFIMACKLIAAAPDKELSLEKKFERMDELFDELRFACKEGIPTTLHEEQNFSVDKKIKYTTDEFTEISAQIAKTKKYLTTLYNKLTSDFIPLYLHDQPDHEKMLLKIQDYNKHLGDEKKKVQDEIWQYFEQVQEGKSIITAIQTECTKLKFLSSKEKSLFAPEKSKIQSNENEILAKLKTLTNKDFGKREKVSAKKYSEVIKSSSEEQKK